MTCVSASLQRARRFSGSTTLLASCFNAARLLLGAIGLATIASAATLHVPGEYGTIQAAIDAAVPGDTVLVAPGTYRGTGNRDIELRGKDVVVLGRDGPDHTIIDCELAGRGFFIHEWETRAARVEGFTITHGRAMVGAGIYAAVSAPTIARCRLWDNAATQRGGGIYILASDALVENCVIHGNLSSNLGAGIASEQNETALIRNCVITGNWGIEGGGVAFPGVGPNRLENCTIAGNLASYGGGVRSINPFTMTGCIVWDNCTYIRGDEIDAGSGAVSCSVVDSSGVFSYLHHIIYDQDCRFVDPQFCAPSACGWTVGGDWTLEDGSICLPENSPCGQLVGALGQGCGGPPPLGACCLSDGSCVLRTSGECAAESGTYLGDFTECEPDPCEVIPVERTTWGQIKARFRE